jgi:hypothetical protein
LNGDAIEDVTYRFNFTEPEKDGKQKYSVRRLTGADATDAHVIGTVAAQGVTREIVSTPTGLRAWAGKAGDPFWIEPDVWHSFGHAFQDGKTIDLSGWDPTRAKNLFAGHTVHSMAREVPDKELLADAGGRHRIGVWAVSTLATDAGSRRSINGVGLPMIHPLFTHYNEALGNRLNAGQPDEDLATHGLTVAKAIAGVVAAYGTAEAARAYGEKVARRFCPNLLPYEVGTAAAFGFLEWNGRSLKDNAPNVMFSIAANTAVSLGSGQESVMSKPSKTFPYVPTALESRTAGAQRTAFSHNLDSCEWRVAHQARGCVVMRLKRFNAEGAEAGTQSSERKL